jgi:hypothetical protein
MSSTPRLGLPFIEAAQAQKHVTHNEALDRLDALVQASVAGRASGTPPAAPAEGEVRIVGPSPTGAWAGHGDALAVWSGGAWSFFAPAVGWQVWVVDEHRAVVWTGTAWKPIHEVVATLAGLAGVGIATTPDATNRLAVRSPASLFVAEPTASGGTGDVRLIASKDAVARTAALLFQSAFAGRAEIGLSGDDDLHVKVSADGSLWTEAIRIAAATGRLTLQPGGLAGGGRLASTRWFGATGTWTRPAGVRFALVFAQGAGGGGGGAAGASGAAAAGSGGGSGALSIGFLDVTATASATVTVGTGGTAGAATGGAGGTGGTSSFAAAVTAPGGAGGAGMTAAAFATALAGGAGASTGSGDWSFAGTPGSGGLRLDAANPISGNGARSFFGGGGRGSVGTVAGAAGTARGSGGGGGSTAGSTTGSAGGIGADGIVWILEFE